MRAIFSAVAHIVEETGPVAPDEPELAVPVEILEPAAPLGPLVLSSPHSGAVYPRSFLEASRLTPHALRRSEDAHVDRLFAGALALGAPMARARFPRAFLDVNREPYELDPRMFDGPLPPQANIRSLRVAGGLGTLPRIVADNQEIYAGRLPVETALRRIEALYRPYHRALRRLIDRTQSKFSGAVLIDCHSMPSHMAMGGRSEPIGVDVVLGDRFGAACNPEIVEAAERALRLQGLKVARNRPYAGGFITEHYGARAGRAHALQFEVNRALYMDEATLEPNGDFPKIAASLAEAARAVDGAARALFSQNGDCALAAE